MLHDVPRPSQDERELRSTELLNAPPSPREERLARWFMGLLIVGFLLSVPLADQQWPSSHLLILLGVVVAFAEAATGGLLLVQASIMRNDAVLVLACAYLFGGLEIAVNLVMVDDLPTRLWLFRLWHTIFVLGILGYALMAVRGGRCFPRARFPRRFRYALIAGFLFLFLLVLYLWNRPFALPSIIHGDNYLTQADVLVNGAQLALVAVAWGLLLRIRNKTVLSVWVSVVATAVFIDILLFILGGRMFSAGLYLSKLNNMLGGTLIFAVILYHYVRIQRELMHSRINLMRSNRRLNRMALSDPLTGLPNRAWLDPYLEHALARARREQSMVAVCLIDLDDFKTVNDSYGHQVGDELLCALAKRLSAVLRKEEFLVRQGGDEFILVLEGLDNEDEIKPVMDRIAKVLAEPFVLSGHIHVRVHTSIGVAMFPHVDSPEALLRLADEALYRSKDNKLDRAQNWEVHPTLPLFD